MNKDNEIDLSTVLQMCDVGQAQRLTDARKANVRRDENQLRRQCIIFFISFFPKLIILTRIKDYP